LDIVVCNIVIIAALCSTNVQQSCIYRAHFIKSVHDKIYQEEEIEKRKSAEMVPAQLEAEMKELKRENCDMKQYVLALQGEVYGARLAAKYLDKELAGRYVMSYLISTADAAVFDFLLTNFLFC